MYYYQRLNEIGKEIALVTSQKPMEDSKHYREISKEYYDAVIELLKEQAKEAVEE